MPGLFMLPAFISGLSMLLLSTCTRIPCYKLRHGSMAVSRINVYGPIHIHRPKDTQHKTDFGEQSSMSGTRSTV